MSINRNYTRELKDNLNYTATWLPNVKLSLGDIGVLTDYEFAYRTNLKKLGIDFEEGAPGARAEYTHVSSDAVTRSLKLAGSAPLPGSMLAQADAGITFSFNRAHAIVFSATDCTIRSITDQDALRQKILRAYESKQWERNYVVVTELVTAVSTSVIVSEGANGCYELRAKADLAPTFEAMSVQGNFSLASDSKIGFCLLAGPGMTPLFRCLGVRVGWFRRDVVTRTDIVSGGPQRAGSDPASPTVTVDEVEYDDYRGQEKA